MDMNANSPHLKSRLRTALLAPPVCLLLLCFSISASSMAAAESVLSDPEKQWLAAHPVICLGVRDLSPLVVQLDGTNHFEGMGMDYVGLIERRLGMRFRVVHYPSWSQLLDAAKNREVDVLVTVPQTGERSRYLDFSPPYYVPRNRTNMTFEAGTAAFADLTNQYGFSSRNDWPELGAMLAKALTMVSAAEHDTIRKRWLDPDSRGQKRGLRAGLLGAAIAGLLGFGMWHYRQRIGCFFIGSIRRNLILVVIVSATPALGIILCTGLEQRDARIQGAKDEAVRLAGQTANWVERLSGQTRQSLMALGQVQGLQAADNQPLATAANGLLQSQRLLDVFVFNRRGDIVAAGRPELVGKINLAQLEVAKEVIRHQCFVVGNSVMSSTYAHPMIHYALPITNGSGASGYFLGKAAQLDTWGIEFDRAQFPQGTTLTITDRRGSLLYHYPVQTTIAALGQPIPKPLWDIVSGPSVSGVRTCPGPDGPWLLAYRQLALDAIPSPDLFLLVRAPQSLFLAGVNRLLFRDLLLLATATLGTIVIAVLLGNRMLLNLLDRITVAARNVGAGRLDARVGLSGVPKGELGELAHTFDAMAAGLERDQATRQRLEQERTALEVQMRQQQKLESIGTLASGVAHEINNPINGAMNYAQLIQDRLPPDSPLVEYTREILHETQRVATIVRNLLAFSRNEKQSHSPAHLTDLVNGTLSLIRTIIRHDQITLQVSVAADLPQLKCRSQQIQQVLMNLMTNARDALNERYPGHDPDKVLSILASLFEQDGRRWIRVTVEDHGTGITPEVRERMFDPFFTTKPRDEGTGLGLAISNGIVKDHHGELTVESEPGKLTRMHMDLPI